MIAAPPGLVARFKHTGTGPKGEYAHYDEERIFAFDDDGAPLVVASRRAKRLVPATLYPEFDGIGQASEQDFIALIPGGGWRVRQQAKFDDGEVQIYDQPLVAWALTRCGEVIPLETDSSGMVSAPEQLGNTTAPVIYHPAAPWPEDNAEADAREVIAEVAEEAREYQVNPT